MNDQELEFPENILPVIDEIERECRMVRKLAERSQYQVNRKKISVSVHRLKRLALVSVRFCKSANVYASQKQHKL